MTELRLVPPITTERLRWERVDRALLVVGALASLVIGWLHRSDPVIALGLVAMTMVSARLASIDFREHRLPNRIVGRLAVGATAGVVLVAVRDGDLGRAQDAVVAGLACCAILVVLSLAGGIGMGDAKYGYCIALVLAWFGWPSAQLAILVTVASSAIVAAGIVILRVGRGRMAYGPYMVLGLVAGLIHAGTM